MYFVLAVAALAMVFLPPVRARTAQGVSQAWRRGCNAVGASGSLWWRHARAGGASAHGLVRDAVHAGRRRATALALALAVVAGLPAAAMLLRGTFRVDSFDPNAARSVDERVAALLQGEELVAPPPLPPDFFTAPEVAQWQPLASTASRQWDLLDDTFRRRLLLAFRLVHEQYGYDMVLIEGYRSPQRQAALAALGPSVTRAGPFESYHQYGLAADCAFLRDGRIVISEKDPWAMAGYERYGQVARSLGLVWGGDWRGLRDLGHVELHRAFGNSADGDNRAAESSLGH